MVYAVGGKVGRSRVNTVHKYNPATNSWSAVAPMPTARSLVNAVVLNECLYAVGGRLQDASCTAVVERYDPVADSWTTMHPMGTARNAFGVCTIVQEEVVNLFDVMIARAT